MWEMELHKKMFHPEDAQTELSEKSPASPLNLKPQSSHGECKLPGCKQFEGKCFLVVVNRVVIYHLTRSFYCFFQTVQDNLVSPYIQNYFRYLIG